MGYIPIFIVTAGMVFLWGMTVYYTLKRLLDEVNAMESLVKIDTNEETKRKYLYAMRMYNATIKDGAARFWAKIFGFKAL
jgi:hypothetical protein